MTAHSKKAIEKFCDASTDGSQTDQNNEPNTSTECSQFETND